MNDPLTSNRRNFIKSTALIAGALALPGCRSLPQPCSLGKLPARAADKSTYLAFFDPAAGAVPNRGMGVSGYVYSDHMHVGFTREEWDRSVKAPPLTLDRATFDRFVALPYIDNLYLRFEWRDVQRQRGKLHLPDAWKWVLEAAEKQGKRWSFRVMNFMPQSLAANGLPDFLQGRFKMIPYWQGDQSSGSSPKYFPEYSDEYLDYWGELMALLGAEFDQHPLLEYVDVSGYGLWGEWHHFAHYAPDAPQINYQPGNPARVEATIERLIRDHLQAFPKTPAVLNLHAADYFAGQRAFEQGLCWARRDSFRWGFSPSEVRIADGLKPGNAMVWEVLMPGINIPADSAGPTDEIYPLPQRYFDIGAHYATVGFNPWDAIWAHEHCLNTYKALEQNIGYRLRPSIVWRRRMDGRNEIVLGLRNDGCVAPPGELTITAGFPDGRESSVTLPAGEPAPGAMRLYALPLLADVEQSGPDASFTLSARIQTKGKHSRVQWAVKTGQSADTFRLKIGLNSHLQSA